jgi:hypothetical protein
MRSCSLPPRRKRWKWLCYLVLLKGEFNMALLEKISQHYIQLKEDGVIEIHRSILDRIKQKFATPAKTILEKYNEKINEQSQKAYDYVVSLGLDPYNLTEEQYENLKNNDPLIIECSRIAEE